MIGNESGEPLTSLRFASIGDVGSGSFTILNSRRILSKVLLHEKLRKSACKQRRATLLCAHFSLPACVLLSSFRWLMSSAN